QMSFRNYMVQMVSSMKMKPTHHALMVKKMKHLATMKNCEKQYRSCGSKLKQNKVLVSNQNFFICYDYKRGDSMWKNKFTEVILQRGYFYYVEKRVTII